MKEQGILFSAPMVRALLASRKTQTRRVFKVTGPEGKKWPIESPEEEIVLFDDGTFHYLSTSAMSGPYPCPYGEPGDQLWVRETWAHVPIREEDGGQCDKMGAIYRADDDPLAAIPDEWEFSGKWKPSIFMPRWASRITLRITDVRVERLMDISPEDAAAEGWPGPDENNSIRSSYPIGWYAGLWEKINGIGSWERNPWVWVVSFERIPSTSGECHGE